MIDYDAFAIRHSAQTGAKFSGALCAWRSPLGKAFGILRYQRGRAIGWSGQNDVGKPSVGGRVAYKIDQSVVVLIGLKRADR